MSYPTTGFTPTMDERTRLRNSAITALRLRRANLHNLEAFSYWQERARTAIAQLRALPDAPPLGPQEPPRDPRVYNRRMDDGKFRPLSSFFKPAAPAAADVGKIGEPMTPRKVDAMRAEHAEFRASGGAHNNPPKATLDDTPLDGISMDDPDMDIDPSDGLPFGDK